jgi:2-polyprenyl-3-methyl-5-hydroxy-6-metoxy-1,4-benzoquinol methylase
MDPKLLEPRSLEDGGVDPALTFAIVDYLGRLRECRPLQEKIECDAATAVVEAAGLPSHHDPQKNWDTFKCVAHILAEGDLEAPILDAGAGVRVVAQRWLHQLGYRELYGCDLKPTVVKPAYASLGFKMSAQELTGTNYASDFFQAVTCISVIEHGVPLAGFAREMARIIRPGGLLLVSTDYWSEPIDCSGIYPYGEDAPEMKILTPADIRGFVEACADAGLELCEPLQLQTSDKAIRWERTDRDYTFIFLAFRKRL